MSEVLTQRGSDLSIVRNDDGTYTARVGKAVCIFETIDEAAVWCCAVRDKGGR